ncbi:MAG: tetratricopeptide repeat protein [Candidatus Aminicenantes bacterium]|nr:tetratricopeptide repeat protein [Candidatus Aminicenantes bacterium]NIM84726.1 tetratricopeptide repeat protein [Candidatus Aminicenantes bacterium]NIN24220.1 tetratricopeptide repeat protein [Candidatus Aminicenantes bacterium]NIN47947.1 tetratricopeptide repeat protein [Candidatus Aminicenantes bacterium]NIN90883.1 tetratricopeptide repeat protein [Candidatus Aminicenantes bacterium]
MAYEKRIKGIINQVISDIKEISGDRKYHFSLARDMETGELPIYSVLDKYSVVASLGYFQSLSPEARQEIIDSPELDEKDWEAFREYTALLEKKGIIEKLVHSYPGLFPDSLLRRTRYCFLSFYREKKKFFLKSEFKGETVKKEMDLEALRNIGSEYLELLEKQDRHYNKTGKAISCEKEFKRLGKQLFELFLKDEWIAKGLKRIYVDTAVDMDDSPHRQIFEVLPFEILYSDRYHFLSISQRIPVIRSYAHAPVIKVAAIAFPFKLLVIISSPPGLAQSQKINVEREKRIFYKTLDPLVYEGKLEIDVIDIATHANITAKLRKHRFDAVHFLGHGFEKGILLESEDEGRETVSCEKFASLFTGGSIKLFFLTSCLTGAETPDNQYSSTVRELRKIGIPVVVGMSRPLTDKAAEILVQEFYLTLFQSPDHSLLDAYTLSLNKISFDPHPLVWANAFIPVIYMPLDVDDFQWPKAVEEQARLYHKFEFLGNLKNHTTGCYGRGDQLRRAKKALQNPNYRILIVNGIGGIGKSAFIYRLIRDLYSDYAGFFVKEFRTETVDKGYDIHRFFQEFNEFLTRQEDDSLQQVLARGIGNYSVPDIIKMIASTVERQHMLLVLENLEQLLERDQDGKFRFKNSDFQDLVEAVINASSGIRLTVGTRDGFQCPVFETTPALKCEIRLEPIESKDQDSVGEIAREATPDINRGKLSALVRHCGGYPLLIQLMANPAVTTDEIEDPDFENLTRAVGGEKIRKVFQYIEKNLQEPERKALFSLSFTFLPFDRGLIDKFLPSKQVDPLLQLPFFQKEISASLYFIPDIITRYFIETYEATYHKRDIKKIHQVTADYYFQVLKDVLTLEPSLQARRKFLLINGSHIPDRLIKVVIYHYLEARNYKKVQVVSMDFFEHLLNTGSTLFLEHVLTTLKQRMKNPGIEVDLMLARISEELYKFDRSLELYLSLLERVDSKKHKAAIFQHMGITYDSKQNYETAIKWYQKSAAVFEEIGDKKGLGPTYHQMGITYDHQQDYEAAIKWYQKSAAIFEEVGDKKGLGKTYHQLGMTYSHQQHYEAAINWYQKSADITEELGDKKGLAQTYHQLGITYNAKQDYDAAIKWYQKSADIKEEFGDKKGLAQTYLNMGITYDAKQDYKSAIKWYQKSAVIYVGIDDKKGLANTYHQIGITNQKIKDYEAAIKWYQRSADIKEEIGDKKGLTDTYHQLGMTYDLQQDYEKAIKWYEKSAEIKERIGDKKGLANTYQQMGKTYENKQVYKTALYWYDKSFNLAKETNNFEGMIFVLGQKSLMYFKTKKYPDAFIHIISAISFAEEYAPHFLPRAQAQLQSFYDQLGEEKSREVLDSL